MKNIRGDVGDRKLSLSKISEEEDNCDQICVLENVKVASVKNCEKVISEKSNQLDNRENKSESGYETDELQNKIDYQKLESYRSIADVTKAKLLSRFTPDFRDLNKIVNV